MKNARLPAAGLLAALLLLGLLLALRASIDFEEMRRRRRELREMQYFLMDHVRQASERDGQCPHVQLVGNVQRDGAKFVCMVDLPKHHEHVNVVSVGYGRNIDFESALRDLRPRTKVHLYDGTILPMKADIPEYIVYRHSNVYTYYDLDYEAFIDVLKVDCEGCEFGLFKTVNLTNVGMILLEVHAEGADTYSDFVTLMKTLNATHALYAREHNPQGDGCYEMAWRKRPTARVAGQKDLI